MPLLIVRPTFRMSCIYSSKCPGDIAVHHLSSHLSSLTSEVVGAPQMMLQQYLSTLPCLPLPSGNLQTPFPSIPWFYLPVSFVFLSFLLLSLSPAELSSPFMPRVYSFRLSIHPFVRSSFHMFVPVRGITSEFYVKATWVEYISPTTHQKAFIFGP